MAAVAIVSADTGHASATNTKTALENKGHTVTLVAQTTWAGWGIGDFAGIDCVFFIRATHSQAVSDAIRVWLDAGIPTGVGLVYSGGLAATNQALQPTLMHLMGNGDIIGTAPTQNEIQVTNGTHEITDEFGTGALQIYTASQYSGCVTSGQSHVGTAIADGDYYTTAHGLVNTFAVEAGTPDMQGAPVSTGARCVVSGALYGGQGAYLANGENLLSAIVDWLTTGAMPSGTSPLLSTATLRLGLGLR